MRRIFLSLKYISDFCYRIGSILGTSAVLSMLAIMLLQVFMRYVLLHPLMWPERLCKVLFIWATYLGAGILIKTKGHIFIDYIITKLPRKVQAILEYIFSITMLGIIIVFTVYSLKLALSTKARMWELGMISEIWIWLSMPIAGLFMIVQVVFITYEDIYNKYCSIKGG